MNNYEFGEEMKKRTKAFAVRIVQFYGKLPKTEEARVMGRQILRSGTSVAAACRAKSRPDFISKMGTVVEESDESLFWLALIEEAELGSTDKLTALKQEAEDLLKVFSRSLGTARHS